MIIEDHPLMRSGIIAMLRQEYPFANFGEACNFTEAEILVKKKTWNLCILDQNLPDGKGIDFLTKISQACSVLVLTMFDSGDLAMLAMERGAKGFVSKSESPRLLLTAIDTVLSGHTWFPQLGSMKGPILSDREKKVLKELLEGKSPTEIALSWGITNSAVQSYKSRLFSKLDVTSVVELTQFASKMGMV